MNFVKKIELIIMLVVFSMIILSIAEIIPFSISNPILLILAGVDVLIVAYDTKRRVLPLVFGSIACFAFALYYILAISMK